MRVDIEKCHMVASAHNDFHGDRGGKTHEDARASTAAASPVHTHLAHRTVCSSTSGATSPLAAARRRLEAAARGRAVAPVSTASSPPRRRLADDYRGRVYSLSVVDFDRLVLRAAGHCELCGRRDKGDALTGLVIDHSHVTGRVRGLVCGICNRALPFLETHKHDDDWLRRARAYLRSPAEHQSLARAFDALSDAILGLQGAIIVGRDGRALAVRIARLRRLVAQARRSAGATS